MSDSDPRLEELRQRLIHVELKLDRLLGATAERASPDQRFGATTYAQGGEDLIILNIFARLGIARPTWLDIGAHHPWRISNTALLYARGCRGVNVEANPHLFEAFLRERPEDVNLNLGASDVEGSMVFHMIDRQSGRNTLDAAEAERFVAAHAQFAITERVEIPVTTAACIVERHCRGRFPDLLSLDVEGHELAVLRGVDWSRPGPVLICAEANDADAETGLLGFLAARGYRRILVAGENSFLLRADQPWP